MKKRSRQAPNDTEALFNAAYSYSQKDFFRISTHHYKKLLEFSPNHAMAWNNLGVDYNKLGLLIRSMSAYRNSAGLGETLAMANIANAYIKAGFEEPASKILNEAKNKENVHQNVGRAITNLAEAKKKEETAEARVLTDARADQSFLRTFADAYFQEVHNCPSFIGTWQSDARIVLEITQTKNNLGGTWTVKPPAYSMSAAEKTYKFSGEDNNRAQRSQWVKVNFLHSSSWRKRLCVFIDGWKTTLCAHNER